MKLDRRQFLGSMAAGASAASLTGMLPYAALGAEDIIVAQIHDQSGFLDIYGVTMVQCFDLALAEINAAGGLLGRQLKGINYDPQSNMQLYGQYAQQAALKDKAVVVHGGITSASREVIRPVLRRFDTLYFYNTLYEGGVCDRNHFATGTTPAQTVEKLVSYCMKRFGKKIYIVAADYNYGQITSDWVRRFTQLGGGQIVAAEFFPLDVSDFSTSIAKIQAAKPDLVMSVLVGGAHLSFYRQWAAAGMKQEIPVASTTFGAGGENVVLTADESKGIIYACGYFEDLDTPASTDFMKRFTDRYGADEKRYLTELQAATYEGVMVWAEGVKAAGSVDRMKVIEALEGGISIAGPSGKVTVDRKTHHVSRTAYIAECENKRFKLLQTHPNQFPADTAVFCDLEKNPNDNTHYKIEI